MNVINDILVPGIVDGCLYALVATGFNLLERTTRIINFAQGDLIMLAALGPIVAHTLWGFGTVPSLLVGVGFALVAGLLIEKVAIRPFIGQSSDFTWLIATLGASVIIEQIASEPFQAQPEAFPFGLSQSPVSSQVAISPQGILLIGVTLLSALALYIITERTRIGRQLTAVGTEPEAAEMLGISVGRMSQVAMVLAAGTAVCAGIVIGPLGLVTPTFGFDLTFVGFVAAAMGGLGSVAGGYAGGIGVGLLQQLTATELGSQWTNVVLFGALLLLYLTRPQGLFGQAPARLV